MSEEHLRGQSVSASEFVRNFGAYSRAAAGEPIHILHHGKAALSLVATDLLQRLSRSSSSSGMRSGQRPLLDLLIDGMNTHVVIADHDLNILRINPAARHLLKVDDSGDPMRLPPLLGPGYEFVVRAVERVRDSGIAEILDADTATLPIRTFRLKIERFGDAISIVSEEITAQTVAREQHEAVTAYGKLIDSLPGLARGTVNVRGLISSGSPGLATLIGSDTDRLVGTRLSSIFHVSERAKVADALEAMLNDRQDFAFPTLVQKAGAEKVPVILSMVSKDSRRSQGGMFLLSEHRS